MNSQWYLLVDQLEEVDHAPIFFRESAAQNLRLINTLFIRKPNFWLRPEILKFPYFELKIIVKFLNEKKGKNASLT